MYLFSLSNILHTEYCTILFFTNHAFELKLLIVISRTLTGVIVSSNDIVLTHGVICKTDASGKRLIVRCVQPIIKMSRNFGATAWVPHGGSLEATVWDPHCGSFVKIQITILLNSTWTVITENDLHVQLGVRCKQTCQQRPKILSSRRKIIDQWVHRLFASEDGEGVDYWAHKAHWEQTISN